MNHYTNAAGEQAREDADQMAYNAAWRRTHPPKARRAGRSDWLGLLFVLALAAAALTVAWWGPALIDALGLAGH